jgi:hypothetical protein
MDSGRAGFTLLEALIASVLGALVIGLVLSVVISQGNHFQRVAGVTARHGTVRAAAELLREELQNVTRRGVTVATSTRVVVRVPLSIGVVCVAAGRGMGGGPASVYLPVPGGGISSDRVSGWGYLNGANWMYSIDSWGALQAPPGDPQAACAAVGADTSGAGHEFFSLNNQIAAADAGDILQLFTLVEYQINSSLLRPGTRALFRREGAGPLIEYVTGLSGASGFQYRRWNQTSFQSSVPGARNLANIEELRVILEAEGADPGKTDPATYRWEFRVPLRNVP